MLKRLSGRSVTCRALPVNRLSTLLNVAAHKLSPAEDLGARVAKARKAQGRSATDVAVSAEIARGTLTSIERGTGNPELLNLLSVLSDLGRTLGGLFDAGAAAYPSHAEALVIATRRLSSTETELLRQLAALLGAARAESEEAEDFDEAERARRELQ